MSATCYLVCYVTPDEGCEKRAGEKSTAEIIDGLGIYIHTCIYISYLVLEHMCIQSICSVYICMIFQMREPFGRKHELTVWNNNTSWFRHTTPNFVCHE